MKTILTLHNGAPPFQPLRELLTSVNIDRVHPLLEPGSMMFQISEAEGADVWLTGTDPMGLAGPVDQPVIIEGMAIVDRSTEGVEPWLWFVDRVSFNIDEGLVDVECLEWRSLLFRRVVPLSEVSGSSRSAPASARQILMAANARNPTHINPSESMSGLRFLMPEAQSFGGQSLGDAFNELALQTNSEWWVDYRVTSVGAAPILRWSKRRGIDRRFYFHLQEGFHLSQGSYSRDGGGATRLVQFLGGGDAPAQRPAGSQAVGAGATAVSRSVVGGRVEAASESQRRRSLQFSGPGASVERIDISPSVTDQGSLVTSAETSLAVPVSALEQVSAAAGSRADWDGFALGDTILLRFNSARLRQGVDAPCRVVALQPDEASGEMLLALKVETE